MCAWPAVENESALASPALLLFLDRLEANLRRMLAVVGGDAARLRPHVKTHKLAPIVARQIALGITKFKTATIAESEMCAAAGAPDVLLAYPPVGRTPARLCELARKFPATRFSTLADHPAHLEALGREARAAKVELGVYLDLDCGMGRTGMAPGPEAAGLYGQLCATLGVRPAGLHAYDGHLLDPNPARREADCQSALAPVAVLRAELLAAGLPVPALVAGGSPTFPFHAAAGDERECSPGTAVLWDHGYAERFPELPFQIAAVVLTRVVSHPGENRLCLDLGHKAVAAENPLAQRAHLVELPEARAVMHSEEHLVVETPRAAEFVVGQTLHAIPRHICPTVALYSEAVVVEKGTASAIWPITARGRKITV